MDAEPLSDWLKQLEAQTPSEVNIANIPIVSTENNHGLDWQILLNHLPTLLELGWSINHIVNISSQSTLDMLVSILLRKTNFCNSYQVYLIGLPSADILPGLIVVPHRSAIQYFYQVHPSPESSNVLCYKDETQIESLLLYFKVLCRRATPLMHSKTQDDADWHGLIVDIESIPGERLQARELFTVLTEPLSLIDRYHKKRGFQRFEVDKLHSMHVARVDAFKDQINYYRFVNIAERKSIEKFIATGLREREGITANPEEIKAQVLTEIEFLQNYHNYYLGFTDEEIPVAIQIKSNKVLIEVIKPLCRSERKEEESASINTNSQALIEAFRRYYEKMWSNIKPEFRQKENVIAWLRAQLDKSS